MTSGIAKNGRHTNEMRASSGAASSRGKYRTSNGMVRRLKKQTKDEQNDTTDTEDRQSDRVAICQTANQQREDKNANGVVRVEVVPQNGA